MGYSDECSLSLLCSIGGEDCKTDFDTYGGFLLWALFMLYTFKILANICDGHLTSVLELIVEKLHISEDVAGATFLAMSSSAPELFNSVVSTFVLVSPSGVGNIVGSALFNLLCIIGVLPLCSKTGPLKIWWYPTVRDAFFYALSVGELLYVIADGEVVLWEAALMLLTYFVYVFYFFLNERILQFFGWSAPTDETQDVDVEASTTIEDAKAREHVPPIGESHPAQKVETGIEDGATSSMESPGVPQETGTALLSTEAPIISIISDTALPSSIEKVDLDSQNHCTAIDGMHPVVAAHCDSVPAERQELALALRQASPPAGNDAPAHVDPVSPPIAGHRCQSLSDKHEVVSAPESTVDKPIATTVDAAGTEDPDDEQAGVCTRFDPSLILIDKTMPDYRWTTLAFSIVVGWVAVFTYFMVDSANRFGCFVNFPHIPMGLIVLAAGTSVPDMIASISVAAAGRADMAAANAVGSNTFDILCGLGLPWLLRCLGGKKVDVPVAELQESIFILAVALVSYLVVIRLNGWLLDRNIGIFMLSVYTVAIGFILYRHYTHFAEAH